MVQMAVARPRQIVTTQRTPTQEKVNSPMEEDAVTVPRPEILPALLDLDRQRMYDLQADLFDSDEEELGTSFSHV